MPRGTPLSLLPQAPGTHLLRGPCAPGNRTILVAPDPGAPPRCSGDPLPQGPHYPGCSGRRGAPYSGSLLPRRPHSLGRPRTQDLPCPGRHRARCPRAQSAPTPSSQPRSPGPRCRFLYLTAGPGRCQPLVRLQPSSHSGCWALPSTLCVPLGFPSPRLPPFTQSVAPTPSTPPTSVFHSPIHSPPSG